MYMYISHTIHVVVSMSIFNDGYLLEATEVYRLMITLCDSLISVTIQ